MGHKFTRRRQKGGFWPFDGIHLWGKTDAEKAAAQGAATGVEPIGEQQQQQQPALRQQPLGQQVGQPALSPAPTVGGRKSKKRRHKKLRRHRKSIKGKKR